MDQERRLTILETRYEELDRRISEGFTRLTSNVKELRTDNQRELSDIRSDVKNLGWKVAALTATVNAVIMFAQRFIG